MRKLSHCILVSVVTLFVACGRSRLPKPLTDANFSAELTKSFEKSKADTKEMIQQAAANYDSKQFIAANSAIAGLLSRPDLSSEERAAASRALINLNQKIAQAAEQGDPVAQQMQR